ncbi:MAG TPA: ATP-binding cassette domain-containing protein [Gemmatimonadaceae bacterium]|nr:ATP-binding cassette domain-containing protein [Gemmatimonadaceae bacterium]
MTDAVLEVKGLTGPRRAPTVFDVSLRCVRAATTLVLGPIHSGKTLLMRHLVGLEQAQRGTICVEGEAFDARGESDAVLRRMRTRIGVVFAGSALISRLSSLENVELPLLEHTSATPLEARRAAARLLSEVGLDPEDGTPPTQLGRAAQRRVALARAIALRPPVVLMDEPSQGLDPHAAAELDDVLSRLQREHGFGLLVLSHDVRYAFGRADYVYVMAAGQVIEEGSADAVRASRNEVVQRLLDRRGAA